MNEEIKTKELTKEEKKELYDQALERINEEIPGLLSKKRSIGKYELLLGWITFWTCFVMFWCAMALNTVIISLQEEITEFNQLAFGNVVFGFAVSAIIGLFIVILPHLLKSSKEK